MLQIVLCYPVEPRHIEQIDAVSPDVRVVDAGQERIAELLLQADIFCGHAKVPVPWDTVVANQRLRWIQSSAAGLDHCLTPAVVGSEIQVSSASGLFANQVAEQAMALLLGVMRSGPVFFDQQRGHEFVRRATSDLHGKTIGIVGFGGNGRRIAEVLAPWQVRILATDLFPENKPAHVAELWPAERLNDLLAESDIVVLCVPLTDLTQGMLNQESIQKMQPGSVIVNVARGPVIVESDLVSALEAGHLGGAGLDVTEVEPLSPDSRLWDLPNVLITPHVGAQSAKRVDDTTDFFCRNLSRFLSGQPLLNLVDKQLGFPRLNFV